MPDRKRREKHKNVLESAEERGQRARAKRIWPGIQKKTAKFMQARKLYEETDMPTAMIAARVGISRSTLYNWLKWSKYDYSPPAGVLLHLIKSGESVQSTHSRALGRPRKRLGRPRKPVVPRRTANQDRHNKRKE